jgi:hypothetical protein
MRSLILRYAWLAVMGMQGALCIAPKPYDASAGKVIDTPNSPKAEVLEAVYTLVTQIRRDGSAIDLMSVMEAIPDETMARYRKPRTKRSEDWERLQVPRMDVASHPGK